jgi:hypothetical protein
MLPRLEKLCMPTRLYQSKPAELTALHARLRAARPSLHTFACHYRGAQGWLSAEPTDSRLSLLPAQVQASLPGHGVRVRSLDVLLERGMDPALVRRALAFYLTRPRLVRLSLQFGRLTPDDRTPRSRPPHTLSAVPRSHLPQTA